MVDKNSGNYQEAIRRINKWQSQSEFKYFNNQWLDLRDLDLTELPQEIGELKELTWLSLSNNKLNKLPKEIGNLMKLERLYLSENNLFELPKEIGELVNLEELYISNNQISKLPKEIGNLTNLKKLYIDHNLLDSLPKEIGKLSNLKELSVSGNRLVELPQTINGLTQLEGIYISKNKLKELPIEIKELINLREIFLDECYELKIPQEIIQIYDAPKAVFNYYFENIYQVKEENVSPLKEVKVLLVGQGRVGKTSLVRYLTNNEKCNPEEPSTHGIIRNKWKINVIEEKTKNGENVQLNIWDFGGQDIQHQTHQFFLNQRSLYLLVLDAGRDETGSKLDYWLKKIETVGKEAPILIAVNKSEQCLLPLAYTELREKFNIRGFFNVSCETGQEIDALRQAIKSEIGKIENVFEPIRKEWFAVKEHLENLEKDYISREDYREICRQKGVTDKTSQDTLLILLHELGVMLNFKEHETEVLNPEWVTRGVYQVVTSLDVQTNKGILTLELLDAEITKLKEQLHQEGKDYLRYPIEKYSFIKDLMKKFELAYQIEDTDNYFVPSLLPKDSPFVGDWNESECLGFRYNYENGLLHETIMSRFIVKMNRYILDKTQWLTGVLLKNEHGNKALVKADLSNGYLTILIDGNKNTRREFLAIIRMQFNAIHKDNYPKDEVPLKDYPDVFVGYFLLLQLEKEGIEESHTTVDGKLVKFNVKEYLIVSQLLKKEH